MKNIDDIFRRYLNGTCTEEELSVLLRYFELDEHSDNLHALVMRELDKGEADSVLFLDLDSMIVRNRDEVMQRISLTDRKKRSRRWLLIAVSAAAGLLLFSVLFVQVRLKYQRTEGMNIGWLQEDVEPGTNRATLLLESGSSIELNEEKSGIVVGADGILYSDGTKITDNDEIQYALLSTPRSGQYQTVLPDGSKVWLNAESSLRYPTAFEGGERRVELTGEAYFEVTHNPKQPFVVATATQHLKVLGTSFNLNAYKNEPFTITTLVSGSVELGSAGVAVTIFPDQQARLGTNGFQKREVDVSPFVAWKEGEFRFKATPLHEALRQIERWYDLEIDYAVIPDDIQINALIKRDKKLSSVLYALGEISDVKFKMEGRRLVLMD